jgi:hypothetical protein
LDTSTRMSEVTVSICIVLSWIKVAVHLEVC